VRRMCLGIPGRIIEIVEPAGGEPSNGTPTRASAAPSADISGGPPADPWTGPRMGVVDFGGLRREVCLAYTPEAAIGDYVIVHVGFAISVVDEEEAARTLEVIRAIPGGLDEISG
jgi:hydrogenase expression/formation protein HypC